jgi:predicted flap endonuclease-1-like 5' DNA nuclease
VELEPMLVVDEGQEIGQEDDADAIELAEEAVLIDDQTTLVASPEEGEAPAIAPATDLPAIRPTLLDVPRNGIADDLKSIRGIGRKNEELLNTLGVFHYGQIAAWTPAEARWVAQQLPFPERLLRDDWIGQAMILASGGHTDYSRLLAADGTAPRDS